MTDNRKQCWLMEGCPSKTGVCYSCVPDGNACPIWRWFKKQIVVQCKDCRHGEPVKNAAGDDCIQCNNDDLWLDGNLNFPDWFCADGERKDGND